MAARVRLGYTRACATLSNAISRGENSPTIPCTEACKRYEATCRIFRTHSLNSDLIVTKMFIRCISLVKDSNVTICETAFSYELIRKGKYTEGYQTFIVFWNLLKATKKFHKLLRHVCPYAFLSTCSSGYCRESVHRDVFSMCCSFRRYLRLSDCV